MKVRAWGAMLRGARGPLDGAVSEEDTVGQLAGSDSCQCPP